MPIADDVRDVGLASPMFRAREALIDVFGRREAAIATLSPLGGHSNHVWLVHTDTRIVVVKLFGSERLANARREWTALGRLSGSGISPTRIAYRAWNGAPASATIVMEHVEGAPARDGDLSTEHLRTLLRLFAGSGLPAASEGEPFAAMAAPSPAAMARRVAVDLDRAAREDVPGAPLAGAAARRMATLALGEVTSPPGPTIFCHGDPGLNNALVRPDGRVMLVDWEDCGLSDPALELAKALHHRANRDHAAQIRSIATQSDPARPDDEHFAERVELFSRIMIFALILRRVGEARRKLAVGRDGEAAIDFQRGEHLLASAD